MTLNEKDSYQEGYSDNHYEQTLQQAAQRKERLNLLKKRHVIKAKDMPWEDSRQGRIKHLINEKMDYPITSMNLYMMVLPPGGKSGKHRHMAEELLYILEGQGYDLHWDPDVEISDKYYWRNKAEPGKYEWQKGDFVYIPPMAIHQHYNASKDKQARFTSATSRLYSYMGFPELEQIEDAPGYQG